MPVKSYREAINEAMAQAAPRNMDLKCYEATEVPFPINRG